ncbi:hypothetical protein U1839_07215 [Sphingomonas sp. RT2P30]|uniref:hypothetical protein n=1 Tax=Parasphingomonas halimpatiens TaxID=3096162 RepID=UPI002FCB0ACB
MAPPPLGRIQRPIVAAVTAIAALFAFVSVSHADALGAGQASALHILLRAGDGNVSFTIDWKE